MRIYREPCTSEKQSSPADCRLLWKIYSENCELAITNYASQAEDDEPFEEKRMKCHICGGDMSKTVTDLPFKLDRDTIVIVKGVPVQECDRCSKYILSDEAMEQIEKLLSRVDKAAELEILRYAA